MTAGALEQPKTFEWWMLSMFAIGISYSAFVSLLIPPYVTETGGDASTAGIVMGIIALGALAGPSSHLPLRRSGPPRIGWVSVGLWRRQISDGQLPNPFTMPTTDGSNDGD